MRISELLRTRVLLFIFSLISFDVIGQEKEDGSLSIQGNKYQNSCMLEQKTRLQNSLYKENIPNKNEAWNILDLLLCAPSTNANVLKVLKSTKPRIKVEAEATGEQGIDSRTITANSQFIESILGQGQAWRASIVVLHKTIRLHYFPNEACIEERVLEFSAHKWKLVETGQACD